MDRDTEGLQSGSNCSVVRAARYSPERGPDDGEEHDPNRARHSVR
jgi:hypothetical protein